MEILINLVIFLVVLGLIWWLIGLLPIPSPIRQAVNIIFVVIAIILLLSFVVPIGGHHYLFR